MEIEDAVCSAGINGCWIACHLAAIRFLQTITPDVAIVDMKAQDAHCSALLLELKSRHIPFIAHSRDTTATIDLLGVPWLVKPASRPELLQALDAVIRDQSSGQSIDGP